MVAPTELRRPPPTTGRRLCIRMLDETQGFQDTLVSRRSSSNVNTPRRTAAITASRLDLTSNLRRRFVEWFRTVCGLSPISTAYTVAGQQPCDAAPETLCGTFPASMQGDLWASSQASPWPQRKDLGHPPAFGLRLMAVEPKTKAARMNSGTTAWADGLSRSWQPKPGSG